MDKMLALIIDDEPDYTAAISDYLKLHGFSTITRLDAQDLSTLCAAEKPDIILLDQRLRETSGTDVLRALRSISNVPCIMVTGLSDPTDRIVNLELGADDEVDKSMPPRELLARIRSAMRRGRTARAAPETAPQGRSWQFSIPKRELRRPDGSSCPLTTAEFEILRLLYEAEGQPVSRASLCEQVFRRPFDVEDRAVDTVVRKLRRKLETGGDAEVIKTVRPLGYVFTGFADPTKQAD